MAAPIGEFKMASSTAVTEIHSYTHPLPEEKVPSFFRIDSDHSYMKSRKRMRGTPTGKTPVQLLKKQSNPSSRWSEEEKGFISRYLSRNPISYPISNDFWRSCATNMNEELHTNRTGASCKSYYRRYLLESQNPNVSTTTGDEDDILAKPLCSCEEVMCQTELSLPITSEPSSEAKISDEDEIIDPFSLDDKKRVIFYLKNCIDEKSKYEDKHFYLEPNELDTHLLYQVIKLMLCHGKASDICKAIMNVKALKNCLWSLFMDELAENAKFLCQKRQSYLSYVNFDGLRYFQWEGVIEEMFLHQHQLLHVLLAISTCKKNIANDDIYSDIAKEIGLIYGILMKRRCNSLSRVQRVLSIALAEECVHQKVFDRLQPLGITTSHSVMLRVQKQIGGHFNTQLIDAVARGQKFRIIGDNVNFMVDVSQQRRGIKPHMEHWFASMVVIQHGDFSSLSEKRPQVPLLNLNPTSFIPQENDWQIIRMVYITIILEILCRFCSYFMKYKFVIEKLHKNLKPTNYDISEVHTSVPLPVLPKNEQKYSDVINILDYYENVVQAVYGKDTNVRIHIGGDQLTRERFSGAKRLRAAAVTPTDRFEHLSPISFEYFHLQMAILTMFYKLLYRNHGMDLGTLYSEKINLGRTKVNGEDVKNHYNDCKDLADSLINVYVVEAAMQFYGMSTRNAQPGRQFETFDVSMASDVEKEETVLGALGEFVDTYVLHEAKTNLSENNKQDTHQMINIVLPDGSTLKLHVPLSSAKPAKQNRDSAFCYGKTLLEIGLMYRCVNFSVKIPNREVMISVMKYCMCILKGHNNKSKYALEILRFLFLQMSVLDLKTAYETFYGLFVNQRGKTDSNIAADLHMEHMVKEIKQHLKSLHANKSESSVQTRSAAFAGMKQISERYDETTNVLFRAKRHISVSSHEDELNILHRLSRVKPFKEIAGRCLDSYTKPLSSPLSHLNLVNLKGWIRDHQYEMLSDLGI